MKITTWNVNGFRAVLRKEALNWIPEIGADILCFQETKLQRHQITDEQASIAGYESIWHSAEKKGYSGVVNFFKHKPKNIEKGIGLNQFDVEGRVIRMQFEDFYLYNIYFPNGGQENKRVPYKLSFYEELLKICDGLHQDGQNIIITGDFNTAHTEIDLKNPKSNQKNTGFLPEERKWVDKYLDHGFADAYRRLYPNKEEYSWWTYRFNARKNNAGWRLDYFLVSEAVMDRIEDVIIHGEIMGSDHCPVSLILKE